MLKFLLKPYPAPVPEIKNGWIALIIGLFIALSLLILEPFNINLIQTEYKTIKVAGFGLITFIIVYIFNVLLPRLLPKIYNDKQWVVYKEILALCILITLIGICNGFYSQFVFMDNEEAPNILGFIGQTFVMGTVPSAFIVAFDYYHSTKKYEEQSKELKTALKQTETANTPKQLLLQGDNEGEHLELTAHQLLYLESNANYVTICYEKEGTLNKAIFRSSLSNMEKQLAGEATLKRCHRSYIVNLSRVQGVAGNAQGFQLSTPPLEERLPVSRKYVNEIRAWFD